MILAQPIHYRDFKYMIESEIQFCEENDIRSFSVYVRDEFQIIWLAKILHKPIVCSPAPSIKIGGGWFAWSDKEKGQIHVEYEEV